MGGGTLSPVVGGNVITSGASVGVSVKSATKVRSGLGVSNVDSACVVGAIAVKVPFTAACTSLSPVVVKDATGEGAAVAVGAGAPEQAARHSNKTAVLIAEYRVLSLGRCEFMCPSDLGWVKLDIFGVRYVLVTAAYIIDGCASLLG